MMTSQQARIGESYSQREQEILQAVDHMLREHDAWESDPLAPAVPSESIEKAILWAVDICTHGDIPARCRDLCVVAMPRLGFEWDSYADPEQSNRRSDGTPTARFWAAFQAVIAARHGSEPFSPKRPQPVAELLQQGVSYEQIANHIYGYRGRGPFVRENGLVDIQSIKKEAATPGSVIPADWLHPLEAQRMRDWESSVEHRLSVAKAREESQAETAVDARSIEDFLLQGAAPDIIAKVKGVTIDEVQAVVRRLQADQKWPPQTEHDGENASDPTTTDGGEQGQEKESSEFDAMAYIAENCRTQGATEIAAALREQGVKMTAKQVGAAITELNQSQGQSV